jgi:RNA polymerase sigma factor (sigma-70 family)
MSTEQLLRRVEPLIRGVCRAQLGHVDGDDAAQQALLTVWRRLDGGAPIDNLEAYATSCANFRCRTVLEGLSRAPLPSGDFKAQEYSEKWADDAPGPEEAAERAAEQQAAADTVAPLLAGLSPRKAEVVQATVMAGAGSTEVDLGIAPGSVRTTLHKALAQLREMTGAPDPDADARAAVAAAEKAVREARQADEDAREDDDQDDCDAGWNSEGNGDWGSPVMNDHGF